MRREQEAVEDFKKKHGHPVARRGPEMPSAEECLYHSRMVIEEASELVQALHARNISAAADAIGDLLYVTLGAAVGLGLPAQEIFWEIHRSNMTKEALDGSRKGGKGLGFESPRINSILADAQQRIARTIYPEDGK